MEFLKSSSLSQDAQVQQAIQENSINTRQKTFKRSLSFAEFSKKLEYRREAVYFKGVYLFRKVSNKMNQLNEVLFYDLFKQGQLNY